MQRRKPCVGILGGGCIHGNTVLVGSRIVRCNPCRKEYGGNRNVRESRDMVGVKEARLVVPDYFPHRYFERQLEMVQRYA